MEVEATVRLQDRHRRKLSTDREYAQAAREVDAAQTLADRVVALRVGAGLTQAQLAKKAGISQPHVSRLEAGIDNPTLDTLERVGSALGVTLDYTPAQLPLNLMTLWTAADQTSAGPFSTTADNDVGAGVWDSVVLNALDPAAANADLAMAA
jgi:transcriptional regulator with XRE-family HTH domain